MFKSIALWTAMTAAAFAADGEYSANTNSDAALRAAPNVTAEQLSVVPAQTILDVTVCFYEGAYCYVSGPSIRGYVAGELLTIAGEQSTVLDAEKARWALMEENRQRVTRPEWEPNDIVVWGDSLSNYALGDALDLQLAGRAISMQGVPGESGAQIAERMLADTRYTRRFKIIWDRHYSNEKPENYLNDLAPMAEKARSTGDFLVISDIRQLPAATSTTDPAADAAITATVNGQLAKLYPDNFVDVTAVLEDPSTRGGDGLHLSAIGVARVSELIASAVQKKTGAVMAAGR